MNMNKTDPLPLKKRPVLIFILIFGKSRIQNIQINKLNLVA